MTRRVLAVAAMLVAAFAAPTTAGPEKIAFPAGYEGHVLYATVERPDNKATSR